MPRLVFGFVTRRIWFTRAEVKHSFSKHHGIASLIDRLLLVLRYGPRARLQGVVIVAQATLFQTPRVLIHSHRGSQSTRSTEGR
jgi:hypothetical protein